MFWCILCTNLVALVLDLNLGLKRGIAAEPLHVFRMAVVLLKGKGTDGLGMRMHTLLLIVVTSLLSVVNDGQYVVGSGCDCAR